MAARLLLAVLAVATFSGCAAPARGGAASRPCTTTAFNLPGHPCLAPGAKCASAHQVEYLDDGFGCAAGKLESLAAPRVPAAQTPALPAAAALPGGAARVTIPDANWQGGNLAAGAGTVWAASGTAAWRVDTANLHVSGPFAISTSGALVAVGDDSVWVSDFDGQEVRRLNAQTGHDDATIPLPAPGWAAGVLALPGAVWVAEHRGGKLVRIDPATNQVVAGVVIGPVGPSGPSSLAFGFGTIWATVPNLNAVVRVDPRRDEVTAFIPVPASMSACGDVGIGAQTVWVSSCFDTRSVGRIDPRTNRLQAVLDLGGLVQGIATSGDVAYLVAGGDPDSSPDAAGRLVELRADDTVARVFDLGSGFISGGAAVDSGAVWVSDTAHPVLLRIPLSG